MTYDADTLERRDPEFIRRLLPIADAFNRYYVRLDVAGTLNIPRTPCLYVGNHNGGISGPDLVCTLGTLWKTLGVEHPLYALAHDFAMRQLKPFGALVQRGGGISARHHNAERVFERGGQVLVYPGGELDAFRTYKKRHDLVLLPRTGFARLAMKSNVPIVPVVASGAHESAVVLTEGKRIAWLLDLPRRARVCTFPVALALPWGIAVGPWWPYLPMPFQIKLRFLPPMRAEEDETPRDFATRVESTMRTTMRELA